MGIGSILFSIFRQTKHNISAMKQFLLILLVVGCLVPTQLWAQLPDGSPAPDFTLTDIEGNTHNLYTYLAQGKMVALDFSATWCGPCWNYMQGGALEAFWEEHGPNGDNTAQVLFIEADLSTGMDDLLGETSESQGNWVEAIPYPIIDLTSGQTSSDYQIAYYPTLYAVCADQTVYELGQVGSQEWEEFITSCMLAANVETIQDATCYGDGEISLDVSGGINPISYTWSNGSHASTLTGVGAGTYSVTVSEGNGKLAVIEDLVIEGAEDPIELASSEIEPALCFESATGSVSISLANAVAPIAYDWSNGSSSQNLTNVTAGTYDVLATDANGCEFEESFTVSEPDELVASFETTPDYCDLENGTAAFEIDGGVGGYELSASEGNVVGFNIIDLPAGVFTATVEDNNGCIWEEQIEIEGEAAPELYFTPDPSISCTQPLTTVTGYVQGGSGDFEFLWTTTNGNIVGPNNQASVQVDAGGDYDLLVTDIFTGCPVESSVEVSSTVDPPAVSAGADTPITCEDLQIELAGSGDPNNTIEWSTSNGNIVEGGNTYAPTISAPGLYIIEVVNPANNCSNLDSVVVINDFNPAVAQYQFQTSGLTMIGTDQSTGSNLTNYLWNFGDGNTSTDPNAVHTYAAEGTYEVCLSVENGCGQSSICYQVQVSPSGSTILVVDQIHHVSCFSGIDGAITVFVNGGTGNYSYAWTGPEGQNYNEQNIDSLIAGVYQLVVSDDQGNLYIGEYTVTQPPVIELSGSTVVDNLCFGQNAGSVAVNIIGGVTPYSYSFNNGPVQSENYINGLPAGTVECMVIDSNGCVFIAGPYTIQEPAVIGHDAAVTGVRCFGESNGAIQLNVTGGVAPYSYLWDLNNQTESAISQLTAGTYQCVVTDHNGCISNASVVVTQPDELAAANIQAVNATNTESNNGSISIEVVGGVAPYTVTWNNNATGTSIQGLVPGEYFYTITDANGCITGNTAPIVISGTTSSNEVYWSQFISIAPNPTKGEVVMITWKGLDIDRGVLTLLNAEGRRIDSQVITQGNGNWDLSGARLSNGIYIVLFETEGTAVPFKLVVL